MIVSVETVPFAKFCAIERRDVMYLSPITICGMEYWYCVVGALKCVMYDEGKGQRAVLEDIDVALNQFASANVGARQV